MNIQKTCAFAIALSAVSFAQLSAAANWYFPAGTTSAVDVSVNIIPENALCADKSGRFLVFDDAGSYTVDNIQLRDAERAGVTSAIYVDTGILTVVGGITLGGNADSDGVFAVRGGTVTASALAVGLASGSNGNLTLSSGTVTLGGNMTIGGGATSSGNVTISGGTVQLVDFLMGGGASSSANLYVSNGTATASSIFMGRGTSATSVISQSGGTLTLNGSLYMGQAQSSSNTINSSGGTLRATYVFLGMTTSTDAFATDVTNTWLQSGTSSVIITNNIMLGATNSMNVTNSWTMTDYATVTAANVYLGGSMSAYLTNKWTLSGSASATVGTTLYIGQLSAGNTNEISLSGNSSLRVGSDVYMSSTAMNYSTISLTDNASMSVGRYFNLGMDNATQSSAVINLSGTAHLTVGNRMNIGCGGTTSTAAIYLTSNSSLYGTSTIGMGASAGVVTTLSVTDNASVATPVEMYLGQSNYGESYLIVSGNGRVQVGTNLLVGRSNSTSGTISMTGGTISATTINVGSGGYSKGVVEISNGTIAATTINVSSGANSSGTISMTGGTIAATGALQVGTANTASGLVSISGGNFSAAAMNVASGASASGTLYISGGDVSITNAAGTARTNLAQGANSTGSIIMTGGNLWLNQLVMGNVNTATPELNLSGTAKATISAYANVGGSVGGKGTVSLSEGAELNAVSLGVGSNESSQDTLSMTDTSSLTMLSGNLTAGGGSSSSGKIFVSDQANISALAIVLGNGASTSGLLSISGGAVSATAMNIASGADSEGTLYISGGDVTITNAAGTARTNLAQGANSAGSIIMTGGNLWLNQLVMGNVNTSTPLMSLSGTSKATISSYLNVGGSVGGKGTVLLAEGARLNSAALGVGSNENSQGTLSLTGTSSLNMLAGNLTAGAGKGSTGTISVADNASISALMIIAGAGENSSGSINVSGGEIKTNNMNIAGTGVGSKGVLTISGGSVVISNSAGTGRLNMGQGDGGSATIAMTGGTLYTQTFVMGNVSTSTPLLDLSGDAEMTISNWGNIGGGPSDGSKGTVNISEGAVLNAKVLSVGANENSTGTLSMTGTSSLVLGADDPLGEYQGGLYVGGNAGAMGTVSITDQAIIYAKNGEISIGNAGNGYYSQTGGTVTADRGFYVAIADGASGTASITAGKLSVGATLLVGDGGHLSIAGTGTASAATFAVRSGGSYSGTLYIGAVSGTPANYAKADTLRVQTGGKIDGKTIFNGGGFVLSVSGTQGLQGAATLGELQILTPTTLTVDMTDFIFTGDGEVMVMTYFSEAGLSDLSVDITGYDTNWWDVTHRWNALTKELWLDIRSIPEPAFSSVLLGLLTLAVPARRRR